MFKQSTAKSLAREEEPLIISGLRGEDLPFKDKIKIVGSEEMMTYMYSNFQQFHNPTEERPTHFSVKALNTEESDPECKES